VVHINAGIAALVTALVIGKRTNCAANCPPPHNVPFILLGTGLLWFGWFGFNAGSALAANGLAVNAFVVTHTAAAAAGLGWAGIEWLRNGKPTIFGVASGAVAGLVAITPAAGYVNVVSAIAIGALVSVFCFFAVSIIKPKVGYDDSLDAFGVHCVGGIWGALATGIFASKAVNAAGNDGLLFGNPRQLLVQLIAVGVTIGYASVTTYLIYKLVDFIIGVRVDEDSELMGLDVSQHNERAYTVLE
jgi:Amt family ammonium transporter